MTRSCARVLAVATISGCLVIAVQVTPFSALEATPANAPGNAADTSGKKEEKAEKDKKGPSFIPIPIFITEPAIGYGLGAALGYFHPRKGETELRWNIFTRWAVLVFAGVGATRGDTLIYEDESGIFAGGVGGRYLFRPEDDLWVEVDVAVGPEDAYAYIQVGHAW